MCGPKSAPTPTSPTTGHVLRLLLEAQTRGAGMISPYYQQLFRTGRCPSQGVAVPAREILCLAVTERGRKRCSDQTSYERRRKGALAHPPSGRPLRCSHRAPSPTPGGPPPRGRNGDGSPLQGAAGDHLSFAKTQDQHAAQPPPRLQGPFLQSLSQCLRPTSAGPDPFRHGGTLRSSSIPLRVVKRRSERLLCLPRQQAVQAGSHSV